MKKCLSILVLILVFKDEVVLAQNSFLEPSDSLNKNRLILVSSVFGGVYTASMVGLNYLWYKDYPRSSFHFFNDNKEWLQVDKAGHMQTAYFESLWSMQALRWSGVDRKKATWYGASMGFLFQSSIEIFDGFSAEWGASSGDLIFNALGSLTMLSQELLWEEQRMSVKYSAHRVDYPEGILEERADQLYGRTFIERMLKDYNGQVYWLSFNTSSFIPCQNKLKWLNIAVGYGAGGMYGGFENNWTDSEGNTISSDAERYRKFFVSLDADLTKIEVKKRGFKPLLYLLNVFKMPAPAFEFNTKGEIIFHPVHFIAVDIPLYLKD